MLNREEKERELKVPIITVETPEMLSNFQELPDPYHLTLPTIKIKRCSFYSFI